MHLSGGLKASRLPKRFPVGTTYVVEGRGGEHGQLRVFSRYVVLPSGERINLGSDAGSARPRNRSRARTEPARKTAKSQARRAKKNR
jgi:hypothetical protein